MSVNRDDAKAVLSYVNTILLSIVGFFCIYILSDLSSNMDNLTNSVNQLNISIAKIVQNQKWYEARLKVLEEKNNK